MKCYAAYAKDITVRKMGSSGGVYPVISEQIIKNGGIVYASVYNQDFSVSFDRIDCLENLKASFTSKYMQSDSTGVYEKVENDLINQNEVLFCGTPCQVNGLQNYLKIRKINQDRLLTIDFICHGVPSFYLFKSFLNSYIQKKLISLNMRNKDNGWNWYQYSWEFVFDDGSTEVIKQTEIPFMYAFSSNDFLRLSCYNCKSKIESDADITIGDFWGISYTGIELDDRYGVSCVIVNSDKGEKKFCKCRDMLDYWSVDYQDIIKNNSSLKESAQKSIKRITAYKRVRENDNVLAALQSVYNYSLIDKVCRKIYQSSPLSNRKTILKFSFKSGEHIKALKEYKEDCCGCMACVSVCPKKAIETRMDYEGFLYPVINYERCINCNLCRKVCPQK